MKGSATKLTLQAQQNVQALHEPRRLPSILLSYHKPPAETSLTVLHLCMDAAASAIQVSTDVQSTSLPVVKADRSHAFGGLHIGAEH